MGVQCVHLSNGALIKTFRDENGSLCYITNKEKKRKVGINQKVIEVSPDVAQRASEGHKFPTFSDLVRRNLPSAEEIWKANDRIDKYTRFSQNETEEIRFEDLIKVVREYDNFDRKRAIRVERDHIVEVQMVRFVWDRANNGRARTTGSTLKCIGDSVNHLDNLNCTLGIINMKKQSAVRMSLSDCENGNGLRQNLLDCNVRLNTTRHICTTFEEAANKIADKVQEQGREVYDLFADEMISMIGYMKLD